MKGNNRYGRAGKAGVRPETLVAFLDHFSYVGYNPAPVTGVPGRRSKRINGRVIGPSQVRAIRRWRSGAVDRVSPKMVAATLAAFGFDFAAFQSWCAKHQKPLT